MFGWPLFKQKKYSSLSFSYVKFKFCSKIASQKNEMGYY